VVIFLLSVLVLVLVFSTAGAWAVREERRRRAQHREEVGT
jgi:hypothetical protein